MIAADASAVVEFLRGSKRGRDVEPYFLEAASVHVPAILDAEVVQVLRRLVRTGHMDEPQGRAATEIVQAMPLTRHVLTPLLPRIWALRENLTAYDAAYVALAEAIGCPLITFDARVASAPGLHVDVVVP